MDVNFTPVPLWDCGAALLDVNLNQSILPCVLSLVPLNLVFSNQFRAILELKKEKKEKIDAGKAE
jgi:hypothetical protein